MEAKHQAAGSRVALFEESSDGGVRALGRVRGEASTHFRVISAWQACQGLSSTCPESFLERPEGLGDNREGG